MARASPSPPGRTASCCSASSESWSEPSASPSTWPSSSLKGDSTDWFGSPVDASRTCAPRRRAVLSYSMFGSFALAARTRWRSRGLSILEVSHDPRDGQIHVRTELAPRGKYQDAPDPRLVPRYGRSDEGDVPGAGSATNLTSTFGGQAMPSAESPYPSLLVVWLHSMRSRWSSTFPSASVTAVTVIWPSLWADRKAPVIHHR